MTTNTPHDRIANLAQEAAAASDALAHLDSLGLIEFELGRLTRAAVEQARAEGKSWAAIGDALGTSKQAAWERYGQRTA